MNAFLFIPLLAATWVIGFILVLYASHYFLTVLDSTASGSDKIVWPEEPLIDWFWKGFYLTVLAGVWLVPIILIGRLLLHDPWVRFLFATVGFWLCFPIAIISSQSATSPWIPFWPGVIARMSQRMPAVFGFYLLSIPITLAFAIPFNMLVGRADASFVLSVVLAPVAAGAFLIYARALGRLGLVLSFTKGGNNERIKGRKKKKKEQPTIGEHDEQPIQMQPSELPPVETPFEGAITGYNVDFDDRPVQEEPVKPTWRILDNEDDDKPHALASADADPTLRTKPPPLPEPSEAEMALGDRSKRVKEPAQPYDASLVTFLVENRSAAAWVLLSCGLALIGGMIQMMREFNPVK